MELKLVTCPETAHLELIGYEDHPLGMLLDSCSRFAPPCELVCRRTCAARLDRRARCEREREALLEGSLDVGDDTSLGLDLFDLERRLLRR